MPRQVNIRAGGSIDSIQVFYGGKEGGHHGGLGGHLHRLRLYSGDRVVRVTGRAGLGPGAGVDQLTLHTSSGRILGPYGGTGGLPFDTGDWGRCHLSSPPSPSFPFPSPSLLSLLPSRHSCSLGFISGWADRRLDSLTLHWRCPPGEREHAGLEGYTGEEVGGAVGHHHTLAIVVLCLWLSQYFLVIQFL